MPSNIPKIGITLSQRKQVKNRRWPMRKSFDYLKRDYHQAIISSGGFPILLPNVTDKTLIKENIKFIDGLLLTGGNDMNPKFFGQRKIYRKSIIDPIERDTFDLTITKLALNAGIPILAICRGHQVLNVALGGDIYQDLSLTKFKTLRHTDPGEAGKSFHDVKIDEDSLLFGIVKRTSINVNSSHHQVINRLGTGLRATAIASDGVIEAIELPDQVFTLGVQWHPESIFRRSHSRALFSAFVKVCKKRS